jgi:hypothetical protein
VLRALPHVNAAMPEEARIAMPLLERALALEPDYGLAHDYLAWCFEVLFVRSGLDPEIDARDEPMARELLPLANHDRKSQVRK